MLKSLQEHSPHHKDPTLEPNRGMRCLGMVFKP